MALILEETLNGGRVVTYHRAAEFRVTASPPIVTVVLESFEDADTRADPTVSPYRREFDYPYFGDFDLATEAYRALLATPGWEDAVADDGDPNAEAGPFPVKPIGTAVWDSENNNWDGEDLYSVAEDKLQEMINNFELDATRDIWSGGSLWFANAQWQRRLALACAVVGRAPDPSAVSRTWWGEDWDGPLTVTGTQLLQLQADMEQREQDASAHLGLKKQEIIDALEITPESAAITAIKAIQWEFDASTWGMPEP